LEYDRHHDQAAPLSPPFKNIAVFPTEGRLSGARIGGAGRRPRRFWRLRRQHLAQGLRVPCGGTDLASRRSAALRLSIFWPFLLRWCQFRPFPLERKNIPVAVVLLAGTCS